jgi:hypothetical protein
MRTAVLFISIATGALFACATSTDYQSLGGDDPFPSAGNATSGSKDAGKGTSSGNDTQDDTAGGDAGSSGSKSGSAKDAGGASMVSFGACVTPASPNGSGHHNEGKDCLTCHNSGNTKGAPHWFVAGTLYDSATGTTPIAGATIELIDATGAKQQLVTAANGNFWTDQQVKFPVKVRASSCPDDSVMMQSDTSGACGKTGCHDSTNRIHLP